MQKSLHPQVQEVVVVCGCGATFKTVSTVKEFHTEICSQCHPFFTGRQKYVDAGGRIDRFRKRYQKKEK